jgi:hypothetical protein
MGGEFEMLLAEVHAALFADMKHLGQNYTRNYL